jgi:hypothetical protein
MDSDRERPEDRSANTEEFDATGTARYAAAREDLPQEMSGAAIADATAGATAALGLGDHMGESETTPGLAGDLTEDSDRPEDQ